MSWNWADTIVIGIILISALIGLKRGLIRTLFKFLSFFVALYISIKFSPQVSQWLTESTGIYSGIKDVIKVNILRALQAQGEAATEQAREAAVDAVMNGLALPSGLKSVFISQEGFDLSKLVNFESIADAISGSITETVISILSVVLLYFAVRVILLIARILLEGIFKLPVLSQINAVGGFCMGVIQGLFSVYLLCTVLYLLALFNQLPWVLDALESSSVASYFYHNNFLLRFFVN